ncbi:hypothetical protein JHK87_043510 [Glycine soja]|nr:hypothetical protein JHK87_043510 [Glycine soja]
MALLDAKMVVGFWAKLPLIRKLLLSHPEVEFLCWENDNNRIGFGKLIGRDLFCLVRRKL